MHFLLVALRDSIKLWATLALHTVQTDRRANVKLYFRQKSHTYYLRNEHRNTEPKYDKIK